MKKIKENIIEELRKDGINTVEEAIKFLKDKEGAEGIIRVDWKWEVLFENNSEPFKFSDDEDLIEWCREQRDTYFSEEEPDDSCNTSPQPNSQEGMY